MKKTLALSLIILPLAFIVYLFEFQPRATAVLSFWIGRNQIFPCQFFPERQTFFCREGNAKNIFVSKVKNNQLFIDKNNRYSNAEWLGLGIYLSELKFTSWQTIYKQMDEEEIKLIVDGFSFGESMSTTTLQIPYFPTCQSLDIKFQNACLFGVGRAIYFRPNQNLDQIIEKLSNLNQYAAVLKGIGFASFYAGKENATFSNNPNVLEGRKIASLFISSNKCKNSVTYFLTCLDKN